MTLQIGRPVRDRSWTGVEYQVPEQIALSWSLHWPAVRLQLLNQVIQQLQPSIAELQLSEIPTLQEDVLKAIDARPESCRVADCWSRQNLAWQTVESDICLAKDSFEGW